MKQRAQHQGNSRHSVIVPYRVGLLLDRDDAAHRDLVDAVRIGIEESRRSGELDRDVELVIRRVQGAPDGSTLDVMAVWRDLFENDTILGTIGPFDDDNGAALRDLIEEGGLPTLTTSADDGFSGRYCFQFTVDHPVDQAHLLLRYARGLGLAHPVLVRESSPRGEAIEVGVRRAAKQDGISSIEVVERDTRLQAHLGNCRSKGANALLYLGGHDHALVDVALSALGWVPLRLTGTEISRAHPVYGNAASLEGWTGLDAVHPCNKVFQNFAREFQERNGRSADHLRAAQGYDIGRLIGIVCTTIRPPSPEGMRDGLDRVRMLLTATGAPGSVVCFSRYDHRGIKNNPHVLVNVRGGAIIPLATASKSAA